MVSASSSRDTTGTEAEALGSPSPRPELLGLPSWTQIHMLFRWKIRIAVESEGLYKSRWSEPAEWPRPSWGLLKSFTVRSSPAPPGLPFLLQPSAPALLMVPQGFTSGSPDNLMASLSTPLLAVSVALFNTSLPVVWISRSQAWTSIRVTWGLAQIQTAESTPRVADSQGLNHRRAWILRDISLRISKWKKTP